MIPRIRFTAAVILLAAGALAVSDARGVAERAAEGRVRMGEAAALCLAAGAGGWAAGVMTAGGAAAGTVLGILVAGFAGWGAFALLVLFVAAGSFLTRLAARGTAVRDSHPARGAGNALANCGVAAACAVVASGGGPGALAAAGLAGSLAAACADTAASEVGQAASVRTRLITTWQPVPAGTDGGVSIPGTLAALVAATGMAAAARALEVLPAGALVPVAGAAFGATLVESVAGALAERRGWIGNDEANLLNTLAGAGGAMLLCRLAQAA